MDAAAEHRHADVTATPSPALRARVLERPGAILPADALLHEVEDTRPFECDGLSAFRQLPMAVALPGDEAQVCEVLRICQELDAWRRRDAVARRVQSHPRGRPGGP